MAGSSALRLATRPAAGGAPEPHGAPRAPRPAPPAAAPPPSGAGTAAGARLGFLLGRGAELVAAVALALGFFGVFLVILAVVFPSGLSLETLAAQMQSGRRADGGSPGRLAAGSGSGGGAAGATELASLSVLQPDVRSKAADAIAWNPARDGQRLLDRDGVQTGTQGRARLEFGAGNDLFLERNSLVIVSARARGRDDAGEGGAVVVLEGEIWARFAGASRSSPQLAVGDATVALAAGASAGETPEFRVRVQKDRTGTISVLSGSLELESGSERVRIGPREFGTVSPEGAVAPPRPLPAEPRPLGPAEGESFRYLDLPPRIDFRWTAVPAAERYRLVVARDRTSLDVVVDEVVEAPGLTWGRLKAGRYVWRVSALSGGVEGAPSAWRAVSVVLDAEAPTLTVPPLPKSVEGPALRLTGRVHPKATVYVSGAKVTTRADGSFAFDLELKPGANVIVVEAVDAMGNTAYWSQIVNARF